MFPFMIVVITGWLSAAWIRPPFMYIRVHVYITEIPPRRSRAGGRYGYLRVKAGAGGLND